MNKMLFIIIIIGFFSNISIKTRNLGKKLKNYIIVNQLVTSHLFCK